MKLCLQVLLIAVLAATAFAKEKEKEKPAKRPKPGAALKTITKDIGAALRSGDAAEVESVFARAIGMKGNYETAKMAPVAKAVAKGVTHKDSAIAMKSIATLGELKVPGTAKLLGKLLAPAAKVAAEKVPMHVAAIAAAQSIHDVASLKTFDKLLMHPEAEIATAAAGAYAGYTALDPKPKKALVGKLVAMLAKLEKARDAAPEDKKGGLGKVVTGLNESLAALTGQKLTTSADWQKWIKEQAKA